MAQTIELEGSTVTAIQAIWGRDGWYLRVRYEESGDEDVTNCPIRELAHDASDDDIAETVTGWLYEVARVSAEDEQAVRAMIEVKR